MAVAGLDAIQAGVCMGKLINMGRAWFRLRRGIFDGETEEQAERMRRYIEWKRLSQGGSRLVGQTPTPPTPRVRRGRNRS